MTSDPIRRACWRIESGAIVARFGKEREPRSASSNHRVE